jgi:hypothetical protein
MLETSISQKELGEFPKKVKGSRVATMTVPSRAREFGFDFEILRAKKKAPPISRQG